MRRCVLADCHSILNIWRNHLSQLLSVNVVSDVRQIAIHTAEPLVPRLSSFEVEMVIENLKDTNHQILIIFDQH
jgi:predicted site-specific integrase-resolvase